MKNHLPWILALSFVTGSAAALAWKWQSSTVPSIRLGATEEILSDWRDAATAFHAANGRWPALPQTDSRKFTDDIFIRHGPDGKTKINGGWLHRNPVVNAAPIPLDGWRRPLQFEVTGDRWIVRSSGPDGVWNTPDDMSSENARGVHQEPEEQEKKPKKKKAAATAPATPKTPDATVP